MLMDTATIVVNMEGSFFRRDHSGPIIHPPSMLETALVDRLAISADEIPLSINGDNGYTFVETMCLVPTFVVKRFSSEPNVEGFVILVHDNSSPLVKVFDPRKTSAVSRHAIETDVKSMPLTHNGR
jgi:hypothetical protein